MNRAVERRELEKLARNALAEIGELGADVEFLAPTALWPVRVRVQLGPRACEITTSECLHSVAFERPRGRVILASGGEMEDVVGDLIELSRVAREFLSGRFQVRPAGRGIFARRRQSIHLFTEAGKWVISERVAITPDL